MLIFFLGGTEWRLKYFFVVSCPTVPWAKIDIVSCCVKKNPEKKQRKHTPWLWSGSEMVMFLDWIREWGLVRQARLPDRMNVAKWWIGDASFGVASLCQTRMGHWLATANLSSFSLYLSREASRGMPHLVILVFAHVWPSGICQLCVKIPTAQ